MVTLNTLNVGHRNTNPTFVQLAAAKNTLTGEAPYSDEFNLADTLISFNFGLPGTIKLKIRNPSEEVEELLINRYKQVNPEKGWANVQNLTQNIFFLKWGYSLPKETNIESGETVDLTGGASNIHKVVLYNIKYNLSTAKERIVELLLLSYGTAQEHASKGTNPLDLKNLKDKVERTSIFENTKKVPVTETHTVTDYDADDNSELARPSGDKFAAPRPTKQVVRETGEFLDAGHFRTPSDIFSRHLIKIAGHYLGYGVYVSLGHVGVALDVEFARKLYKIVYAKSFYTYTKRHPASKGSGSILQGTKQEPGFRSTVEAKSDYDKIDLNDEEALQFLNDIVATNSSFTRVADQELIIPMPGANGLVSTDNPLSDKSFWQQTKEAFGADKQERPSVPENIKIPESVLVATYQQFFADFGIASFHLEHYDSKENQIEGLEVSKSQTDGRTYVDSENPKPNVNQQTLAAFDDDAPFLLGQPSEDVLEAGTQTTPNQLLAPHMSLKMRKRLRGTSLLYNTTGYWKEHTAVKLSDWKDSWLLSLSEFKSAAVPVVQDTILLEDGTVWSGYRTANDITDGISGYTEYLSDTGSEQVKTILAGRKAASTAANSKAKDDMGTEPEASQPGDFPSNAPTDLSKKPEPKGFIQTKFKANTVYDTLRSICNSIWLKVGTDIGVGLRVELEDTDYMVTDDEYAAYLADRGNFMTAKKLKALFGVIYIAPKKAEVFNEKVIPPLPIKSFDVELPNIKTGPGKTIPIQLSYGFQKRNDSIIKSLDIQLDSGQLNHMLHVQPEVVMKAFDLVKLHSANFSENIGQITNSMLYILTQNSNTGTLVDDDAIALQKLVNENSVTVTEGSVAFSQRAIQMIFQTVANYAADPAEFVGTTNVAGGDTAAVYEAHLETLLTHLNFLSQGANHHDTEFLTDLYFGPAEFAGKKVDFFMGGSDEDTIGSTTIEPFKVLVPQTWDSDPMSNGAVKAQIAKLAGYRQLREILSGIKVNILGIPELNRHMSEVSNRLVYLRINNPRDLGTLHWATGYYKINSISHDISTNGGYVTSLELYQNDFQSQGVLANFEAAAAAGKAERLRAAKAGENGGAGR